MIQNFETVLFKIKRRDGKEFQNDVSTISLKIADEFANSWINAFDSFGIIRDRDSDNAVGWLGLYSDMSKVGNVNFPGRQIDKH